MNGRHPGSRRRAGGVTLIELMVVMTIIAILLGVGMALFSESNKDLGLRAAKATVMGTCRYARTAARNSRAPSMLRVDPDGRWISVVLRRPMGAWHFEDDVTTGALGHNGSIHEGATAEEGRIGRGLHFKKPGWVECSGVDIFSPTQGLLIEAWLLPERHGSNRVIVARKGQYSLAMDKAGALIGGVGTEDSGIDVIATGAILPLGRWSKVALVWDGDALTLFVNDHPLVKKAGKFEFGASEAPLTIGSKDYPLNGWVDEVRVDALIEDSKYSLPDGLSIKGPEVVKFDASGGLDREWHTEGVTLTVTSPLDSAAVLINLSGTAQ